MLLTGSSLAYSFRCKTRRASKLHNRPPTATAGLARFADVPAGRYTVASGRSVAATASQVVDVTTSTTADVTLLIAEAPQIAAINVTATHFREAQIALSPKVGTTVYTIDQQLIDDYGKGANTPMNEVLLQLPRRCAGFQGFRLEFTSGTNTRTCSFASTG